MLLVRPFSIKEVRLIGVESLGYDEANAPPMMVVVIKGDFDVTNMPSSLPADNKRRTRVKYIDYLYDLRAGFPMVIAPSLNGGKFRQLLNDPTIPEDPTLVPEGTPGTPMPAPQLPTEPTVVPLMPGQVAPTILPAP